MYEGLKNLILICNKSSPSEQSSPFRIMAHTYYMYITFADAFLTRSFRRQTDTCFLDSVTHISSIWICTHIDSANFVRNIILYTLLLFNTCPRKVRVVLFAPTHTLPKSEANMRSHKAGEMWVVRGEGWGGGFGTFALKRNRKFMSKHTVDMFVIHVSDCLEAVALRMRRERGLESGHKTAGNIATRVSF